MSRGGKLANTDTGRVPEVLFSNGDQWVLVRQQPGMLPPAALPGFSLELPGADPGQAVADLVYCGTLAAVVMYVRVTVMAGPVQWWRVWRLVRGIVRQQTGRRCQEQVTGVAGVVLGMGGGAPRGWCGISCVSLPALPVRVRRFGRLWPLPARPGDLPRRRGDLGFVGGSCGPRSGRRRGVGMAPVVGGTGGRRGHGGSVLVPARGQAPVPPPPGSASSRGSGRSSAGGWPGACASTAGRSPAAAGPDIRPGDRGDPAVRETQRRPAPHRIRPAGQPDPRLAAAWAGLRRELGRPPLLWLWLFCVPSAAGLDMFAARITVAAAIVQATVAVLGLGWLVWVAGRRHLFRVGLRPRPGRPVGRAPIPPQGLPGRR